MENPSIQSSIDDKGWLGEVFRLTVFFFTPGKYDTSDWWQLVTGELPESRNSQPKVGFVQEEGHYQQGRLVLTTQPDRADWLFFPSFDKALGLPDFGNLKPYGTALTLFSKVASDWFKISPPISRIAFGMVLHMPVADRPNGYRSLANLLPTLQIDPENSSDFLYQINRRRLSKRISSLPLNRLTKWAVANVDSVQFPLGIPTQVIETSNQFSVRLEIDVNTAQEFRKQLPPEQVSPLYDELVSLAIELASKGDIP